MIAAVIKALEYLGTIFLLGTGVYRFLVVPGAKESFLPWGAWLGAGVLVVSSLSDIVWRLVEVLGRFDMGLTAQYFVTTGSGRLALLRIVLALLLPLTFRFPQLFAALSFVLLYSFSAASHATVLHGYPAFVADLGHFLAASLWGGSVLYTALGWPRLKGKRFRAITRVSHIGLVSVLLLSVTGVYASVLHLETPDMLLGSPYGIVLTVKLAIIALILGMAGLNRWYFLPKLLSEPQSYRSTGGKVTIDASVAGKRAVWAALTRRFRYVLIAESILLLTVFATTGLLSTSPLPHD